MRRSVTPAIAPAAIGVAGLVVAALGVHGAPALAAVGPVRRRLLPALAGTGRPDHVALTFDDGPDRRSTPFILDVLARHSVRCTMFTLGHMVAADPELARDIVDAGHELAVHGWDHRLLTLRGPTATADDIHRAHALISGIAGYHPRWYRPPYGVATAPALLTARRLRMRPVLWTAWGRDWTRRASRTSVAAAVRRLPAGGATILLHDADPHSAPGSWRATRDVLPSLIEDWNAQGLTVGPLHEHGIA